MSPHTLRSSACWRTTWRVCAVAQPLAAGGGAAQGTSAANMRFKHALQTYASNVRFKRADCGVRVCMNCP